MTKVEQMAGAVGAIWAGKISWIASGITAGGITFLGTLTRSGDVGFAATWSAAAAIGSAVLMTLPKVLIAWKDRNESASAVREREWQTVIDMIHQTNAYHTETLSKAHGIEIEALRHAFRTAAARETLTRIAKHAAIGEYNSLAIMVTNLQEMLRTAGVTPPPFKIVDIKDLLGQEDEGLKELITMQLVREESG